MQWFQRVCRSFACSVLIGGLAAPPAAGQVTDLWFEEPHDGTTWHRGDAIRARIVPDRMIPGAASARPKLELVIGDKTHEVEGRFFQNGSRAQFVYAVQSDDAATADEVRMAKVSLAGVDVDLSGFTATAYAVDGGSRGAAPVMDRIALSSFFFVPADGVYRPGEEIVWFARFHKAVTVSGAPVLMQRIGEEMREARYRPDLQTLPGGVYFTYTVQEGDCDTDGVGIPANAISGGSIREADGSRAADTSHPGQDPARDVQADAIRMVACTAVPAAPAAWLALLASFLLAAGAHLVRLAPPRPDHAAPRRRRSGMRLGARATGGIWTAPR